MKRIFLILFSVIVLAGCSDAFLDTEPLTKKTDVAFYATTTDMEQALTAAYVTLVTVPDGGGSILNSYPFVVSELMSDDRFGGGGDNDRLPRAICDFKIEEENQFWGMWARYYRGIFRLNMMLENINKPVYESDAQKGKFEGEAAFLRGLFYFDLMRMFGSVPLVLQTKPQNLPQAEPAAVYAQIATDLKRAIEVFPNTQRGELGRANKWAAQALMARVFLFYTGYYEQTSLPLADGGSVTKAEVIAWLENCISASGYQLMPEFRNLWPYSVATAANSSEPYKFTVDEGLSWYGETGDNKESMFALKFSTFADWGTSIYYSNQMNLFFGWRSYSYKGTMGEGWGMGTVNSKLWDEWPDADIRKRGSMINVKAGAEVAVHGVSNYDFGVDFHDKQMDETGIWQLKYRPINLKNNNQWSNYSVKLYNAARNMQLDNMQDVTLIRFADVHLMHSELTETNTGINAVRARVELGPVGWSLDNLKKERRYELAFEGLRYHDLLRWAGKSNLSALATVFQDGQNGVEIIANGIVNTKSGVTWRPETGGFIQIPNREILLSGGVLEQNPAWGPNAPHY